MIVILVIIIVITIVDVFLETAMMILEYIEYMK